MDIGSVSGNSVSQLKWINLRNAGAGKGAGEISGTSSAQFAAMMQELSLQEGSTSGELALASLDSSALSGLLWQNIGAAGSDYAGLTGSSGSASVPAEYEELIQAASAKYNVPVDLIKAVIDTESSFNQNAVSSAGAKGLMQLMDGTASGLGVSNSFDPAQNIDGGVRYLSYQLKRYGGEEKLALAAYNAGPGRVNQLGVSSDEELMSVLYQLPEETQAYIGKIERARAQYAL